MADENIFIQLWNMARKNKTNEAGGSLTDKLNALEQQAKDAETESIRLDSKGEYNQAREKSILRDQLLQQYNTLKAQIAGQ